MSHAGASNSVAISSVHLTSIGQAPMDFTDEIGEFHSSLKRKKVILTEQATFIASCVSSYSNSSLQKEGFIFVLWPIV